MWQENNENRNRKINKMNEQEYNKKIDAYKFICMLAGVPQPLIDNPEILSFSPPTEEDIKWAKQELIALGK